MSDTDLRALFERATADLPEVDFVEEAWTGGLRERGRRRRRLVTGLGAVAAAAVAVAAVQLGGSSDPAPPPQYTVTTPPSTGTLADGTAYSLLPLEGTEGELPQFLAGLPSVIDPHAPVVSFSALDVPLSSAVAVYLRPVRRGYQPVVVEPGGKQFVADAVTLSPTRDRAGNEGVPLGPKAIGGGRYAFFPQPGKVVQLDVRTGEATSYAVASPHLEPDVGWASDGALVVHGDGKAWSLNPWVAGGRAVPTEPARGAGAARLVVTTETRSLGVTWFDPATDRQVGQRALPSPVTELWGQTIGSAGWVASGAFFDQNLTHPVIQRGNGPIYQGVVAVPLERGRARLLLAPESPDGQTGRFKRCCSVLGWADGHTLLLQTGGSHGSWVLAWDVNSGQVFQVTRVPADPRREPVPVLALNVGWRY